MNSQIAPPLDELLAQATCAVLVDGKIKGTAWLVSDEGHLLTAGHVLGKVTPLDEVEVRFSEDVPRRAHKIQWGFQQEMGVDFAVLKIADWPANRCPLPISLPPEVRGGFKLRGYGKTLQDQSTGAGKFLGPFDPQNSPNNRLFQLRSPELGEGGYSGGAVFSETLQTVIAVQIEATQATAGAGRDTLLAMPLYRIAPHWEQLHSLARDLPEESDAHSPENLDYEYDVFLSYVEEYSDTWVRDCFHKLLDWLLQDSLGRRPRMKVVKHSTPKSGAYPLHLREALAKSRCLVSIWSPSYFESSWCIYECAVMLERERQVGYGTLENPTRLILPVVACDGNGFPPFAKDFVDPFDCREYVVPPPVIFEDTETYIAFRNQMTEWADHIIESINRAPMFRKEWLNQIVGIPEKSKLKCKQPIL